jgi:diguanylate cyclase (GGDEF)-like protein
MSFALILALSAKSLRLATDRAYLVVLAIAASIVVVAVVLAWVTVRRSPGWLIAFPIAVCAALAALALLTDGVAATYVGFLALGVMYIGLTLRRAMVFVFTVAAVPAWLLSQETIDRPTIFKLVVVTAIWTVLGVILTARCERDRVQAHELEVQANTDALTGLASKTALTGEVERLLRSRSDGGASAASVVLMVDLDGFKGVNDMFGHAAGDELLVTLARRIRSGFRPSDMCARLGGDEFAIVLDDIGLEQAKRAAERLTVVVAEPVVLTRGRMAVTASIGVASLEGAKTATEVLRDADLAMYDAKSRGRNRVSVFERELGARRAARLQLETDLHGALERGEFELFYQPVVHLQTAAVTGGEALLRWNHPTRGLLTPDQFLSTSEEIGVIVAIGDWVLNEACRQAMRWQPKDSNQAMTMAVNLSAPELLAADFITRLGTTLATTGLAPELLVLEISERLVVSDAPLIRERIDEIRGLGVRIAIDDFGTGYLSLAYLRELPVDILKIDRSFVETLGSDAQSSALVRSIVAIADALNVGTIAEGVETAEQIEVLTALGCEVAQGYWFAKPDRAEHFGLRGVPAATV